MEKVMLFAVVILAAAVVHQSSAKHHWKHRWHCFPDNATKARCFADFPNAAHHSKSWLRWFMPQAKEDSYTVGDTVGLDTDDFVISKIENDPKQMCQYKDPFSAGMKCLVDDMTKKCPHMNESRMVKKFSKIADGIHVICKRVHEMDSVCMHVHWDNMHKCRIQAYGEMQKDFDAIGHNWHRHHHGSKGHNSSSSWKWRGGSNSTSSGKSGWSFNRNGTRSWGSGGWNRTSSSRWNRTRGGGGGMGGGDPQNATAMSKDDANRFLMYCKFKYITFSCARDSVMSCHGKTARILFEFMRNMTDPMCQAKMDEWDEGEVMKQVSDCKTPDCSAAPPFAKFPWLGILTSLAFVVIMTLF